MTKTIVYYQKTKTLRLFASTKASSERKTVPWTGCAEKPRYDPPCRELGPCAPTPFLWPWSRGWQVRGAMLYQALKDEYKFHFPNPHLWGSEAELRACGAAPCLLRPVKGPPAGRAASATTRAPYPGPPSTCSAASK